MPLPGNVNTIVVTGKYLETVSGDPVIGQVTFSPSQIVVDPTASPPVVLVPKTVVVVLSGGSFSVALPATNDTDLEPVGWFYTCKEEFAGGRTFNFQLDVATPGGTIDITDVVQIVDPGQVSSIVTSVDGRQGVVTLGDLYASPGSVSSAVSTHAGATDPHGDRSFANATFIPLSQKANANGVASLGADGKVPTAQLPSTSQSGVTSINGLTGEITGFGPEDLSPAGIPASEKGAADGVATLNSSVKIPAAQIDFPVSSVNSQTGVVVLNASHVNAVATGGGSTIAISDTTTAALAVTLPAGDRASAPNTFQVSYNGFTTTHLNEYGEFRTRASADSRIPCKVRQFSASQSANLQQWENSDGSTALASVSANGTFTAPNIGPNRVFVQSTQPTANAVGDVWLW